MAITLTMQFLIMGADNCLLREGIHKLKGTK